MQCGYINITYTANCTQHFYTEWHKCNDFLQECFFKWKLLHIQTFVLFPISIRYTLLRLIEWGPTRDEDDEEVT